MVPPSVPPGTRVGRPRIWQAAVIGLACALTAAGSCAEFLRYGPYPAGEPYAFLFLASALLAGGPVVLASFRFWRRRHHDAWPTSGRLGRLAAISVAVAFVGYLGTLVMVLYAPARLRIPWVASACISVAATGFVVAIGAVELLVISAVRDSRQRRVA